MVARYDDRRLEALVENPAIIRNRLKIESAVGNAAPFSGYRTSTASFDRYVWQFMDGRPRQNRWRSLEEVPAETSESRTMSRDLKRRGFRFVGPTI